MSKRLRLTIEGVAYYADLQENALAESIAAMCPSTTEGHENGLYYFEGWNAISLVFRNCNTAPYQIHHIGDFEEDVSVVLEKLGRSICILCEAE